MQKFEASAPSNIALIKYMGKLDSNSNVPTNSSLSLTLNSLRTYVRLTYLEDATQDRWQALEGPQYSKLNLSEKAQKRFLDHLAFLKSLHHFSGSFLVESGNNFPSDCGLASSASSFAALTKVSAAALISLNNEKESPSIQKLAELSRKASGSSCRSFFEPWAIWQKDAVKSIEFPCNDLSHDVIVVADDIKSVSSSEAHRRVVTSALFSGRPERAEKRLVALINALNKNDWRSAYEISWNEFWDMHALFETSEKPFGYLTSGSLKVLRYLQNYWSSENDGPIVTMDAGPNVHLIYRQDQKKLSEHMRRHFSNEFKIYSSSLGSGDDREF